MAGWNYFNKITNNISILYIYNKNKNEVYNFYRAIYIIFFIDIIT